MKKILTLALMTVMAIVANAQDVLRISADIEATGDTVKMYVLDINQQNVLKEESIVVCENKFETTFDNSDPVFVMIFNTDENHALKQTENISFYGMPREHCIITGKWNEIEFAGDKFYKELNAMNKKVIPAQPAIVKLATECQKRLEAGETQEAVVEFFQTQANDIVATYSKQIEQYIKENPNSEAAATLLADVEDSQKIAELYAIFSDNVKNGRLKPLLDRCLAKAKKEEAIKENEKNIAEGKPAPDFTLNDINGNPLKLSSLRGKYVVLDFWGSWCGWCIKGVPQMKEYYAKYSSKMEILGIDCGDTDEKWKEAVAKHEMPWKHVYHPENGEVTNLYAIQGFPTKIVIDPQGNIAKVVVGEDPEFYTYLDELFK